MTDEDAFLRKLLDNPADDVVRLVYADWLDEHGDAAKAEFLRLEAERATAKLKRWRAIDQRLQALAADLDTDWLSVVSKLLIERCGQERHLRDYVVALRLASLPFELPPVEWNVKPPEFAFECPKSWENLQPTDDLAVRYCKACRENVHYCDTIVTAREHAAQGHCVAVDLGIIRTKGDLDRPRMRMGRISPLTYERERIRREAALKPDPVSEKREQAKQERNDATSSGETP